MANGLAVGASYALLGLGISILYSATRFFNLAYAGVLTWSAYAALIARVEGGWPLGAALGLAVVAGATLGIGLELALFGPLRRQRRVGPLLLLLASLGCLVVLENVAALVFGDASRALRVGPIPNNPDLIAGIRLSQAQLAIILTAAIVGFLLLVLLKGTALGLMLRAVAGDAWLAQARGLPSEGLVLVATGLGSALGAVGAVFVAYEANLAPHLTFSSLLKAVVAMIVGGTGSFAGPLVGGLVLGQAEQAGVWVFGAEWQNPIAFGLLLLFLLIRPQGLLGRTTPLPKPAGGQ